MLGATPLLIYCMFVSAGETVEPGIQVERNVAVKMRDGVVLRVDVYRPDQGGPYPVLVRRSPYGKRMRSNRFPKYVKAGYILVSEDARGRYESEGKWESLMRAQTHDGEDGYDTIEWAAKLPGSTGKVASIGISYNSFLQWRTAPLRPPSAGSHVRLQRSGPLHRPGRAWLDPAGATLAVVDQDDGPRHAPPVRAALA